MYFTSTESPLSTACEIDNEDIANSSLDSLVPLLTPGLAAGAERMLVPLHLLYTEQSTQSCDKS